MREIQAPNPIVCNPDERSVFLAGSIEMGAAEDWQKTVVNALADMENLVLFNPRRDDWDSSWVQSITNLQFNKQVTWELRVLSAADKIILYLAPGTRSPISLLELGLFVKSDIYVCCPEGFWRKGNVDIVCARLCKRPVFATLESALASIKRDLGSGR